MQTIETVELQYLTVGSVALGATLYLPDGDGPFPGLVDVHGGAWVGGDRLSDESLDRDLAARGIAVLAIDFRVPPAVRYPAPVADINYALRWLKANGERWGIPAQGVGVLGASSGGHQGLLATLRPHDPRYLAHAAPAAGGSVAGGSVSGGSVSGGSVSGGSVDAAVSFAVVCWGVTDPVARYAMARANGIEHLVEAHGLYWPDEAAMAEGSPQAILEGWGSTGGAPGRLAPLLVIQGTADGNLTPDMADRLAAAYRGAGGDVTLEKFEGEPHAFITADRTGANARKATEIIAEFVLRWGSGGAGAAQAGGGGAGGGGVPVV